jgi:translocation and assembly module TamB
VVEGSLAGTEIRTPAGDFDRASVELDFTRPRFEMEVRADREGDLGVLEIDAAGRIEETGEREIELRRAEVDLEQQRWRLPAPATIAWTAGEAVRVEGLRLEQTGGPGLIRMSGIVAPFDQTDVQFQVVDLPVADVALLLATDFPLTGRASLEGTVRGPAGSPELDITLGLVDGTIRDVPVTRLSSRVEYRDRTLAVAGDGLLGDSARFEVEGSMPVQLELGMPPVLDLLDDGRISGRVVTDEFPLATLDPGIASVQDLAGRVQADLRIAGTIGAPELSGGFSLADGGVTVPLLDQRYDRIEGRAELEGRTLRVVELLVRSDSVARVTGEIRFDELTNPTLALTTELEGFRPQGVDDQQDAAVWGTLRLGGTARTPRLSGDVRLDDGTVDVAFLQQGPGFGEQMVGVAESFDANFPEFEVGDASSGPRIVGLTVRAGSDVWFEAEEARAQLQGTLTVDKRGSETSIQGTLEGQQGTFNLRVGPVTRRFEVVDASIRFFGSPDPNPGLDITAARVIRTADRGDIEIRAIVSGTLNNPSLTLATAEGTTIPEAEALNFLVFGRSSTSLGEISPLGGGGQAFVDALAFAGVADYFSAQIADETGLGLDYFQIQMQPGGAQGGTELFLLLGEEVLDEIFLLFQLPLTEFSELWAVSGEWRIDREWTLEAALEPPDRQLGLPAPQRLPFDTDQQHQVFTAIRWRWTY